MPSPDYALMLWCGRLPVLDYAGGIVISKHRDIETINIKTHIKGGFTKVKKGLGWYKIKFEKDYELWNCESANLCIFFWKLRWDFKSLNPSKTQSVRRWDPSKGQVKIWVLDDLKFSKNQTSWVFLSLRLEASAADDRKFDKSFIFVH